MNYLTKIIDTVSVYFIPTTFSEIISHLYFTSEFNLVILGYNKRNLC